RHDASFYLRQESGKQTRTDPGAFSTTPRQYSPGGRRQRTSTERIEVGTARFQETRGSGRGWERARSSRSMTCWLKLPKPILHNTCVTTQSHAKVDQRTPVTVEIPVQ